MKGFIRAEIFKTFHTKEYYYFLLLPLGVILFVFYEWLNKTHNQYLSNVSNFYFDKSPWHMYFANFMFFNCFFFSFLTVIIVYFNVNNEHNKKIWKYIYTLPNSDIDVFLSKQITCWIWIFLSLLLNFLVAILLGYLLAYLNKNVPFTQFDNHISTLILIYLKLFLALLPLATIQILLSMFFKGKLLLFIILPIFSWLSWIDFSPYNLAVKGLFKVILFEGKKYSFGHNISFLTKFELYGLIFLVVTNALFLIYRYRIINKMV